MPPIEFTRETLDNRKADGDLSRPMKNAAVVHVRVVYHVGSRNEKEDRQGFAHMFEHMMFRGLGARRLGRAYLPKPSAAPRRKLQRVYEL